MKLSILFKIYIVKVLHLHNTKVNEPGRFTDGRESLMKIVASPLIFKVIKT